MRIVWLCVLALCVGCDSDDRIPVDSPEIETAGDRIETNDPEVKIVRAWIAENSDSGTWDEVRWYPPVSRGEGINLYRMKYRTRSPEGGKVLFDHIFWHENGTIQVLNKKEHGLYSQCFEPRNPNAAERAMRHISGGGLLDGEDQTEPLPVE